MVRRIHCGTCDKNTRPQHPEDVAVGWQRRRVEIRAKKPAQHNIQILESGKTEQVISLPSIVCDGCGEALRDGSKAYAITEWRKDREGEPGQWEQEYGEIV